MMCQKIMLWESFFVGMKPFYHLIGPSICWLVVPWIDFWLTRSDGTADTPLFNAYLIKPTRLKIEIFSSICHSSVIDRFELITTVRDCVSQKFHAEFCVVRLLQINRGIWLNQPFSTFNAFKIETGFYAAY